MSFIDSSLTAKGVIAVVLVERDTFAEVVLAEADAFDVLVDETNLAAAYPTFDPILTLFQPFTVSRITTAVFFLSNVIFLYWYPVLF